MTEKINGQGLRPSDTAGTRRSEAAKPASGQGQGRTAAADKPAVTTVNINSADAQTLAAHLKGVGDSRAAEIVRHRETYGPFASAEELTEVKGIGQSTLDMNRDVITLE